MKKEDINYELISKIEIQVKDTLFYIPGETIKGEIIIYPKYQIKDKIIHLNLKVMQYEFWEYKNIKIKELKNIYKTVIQDEKFEHEINKEEPTEKEKPEGLENFSIIEIEKENKIISFPFEIKLEDKKILPTFQYQNKDYILGIRHLLLVECKEYNSSNYTGLFVGKGKKIEFSEPKEIKESYIVDLGSLDIIANYPKLSYESNEEINVNIKTNSNLHFKKITKITQTFYRNIKWVGYMKNSLLNKTIYNTQNFQYNENKYNFLSKVKIPIRPIIDSVKGLNLPGLFTFISSRDFLSRITSYSEFDQQDAISDLFKELIDSGIGAVSGFFKGFINQGEIIKECLNINEKQIRMENDFTSKIDKKETELLIENLKKFVYFKDNKVIGFIKFGEDITPPVNGYYFNCEYNVKIEVEIEGIIINRNKYLKTQIDLYDSDEYITKMKNIFKN